MHATKRLVTNVVLAAAGLLAWPGGAWATTILTVTGSGPSPLGQPITVIVDGTTFTAYGIDVFTPLGFGNYQATFDTPDHLPAGPRAAWIYEQYGGTAGAGLAVQLALWDVVNDGGNGLSAGLVQLSPFAPASLRAMGDEIITASVGQSSVNAVIAYLRSESGVAAQTLILAPFQAVQLDGLAPEEIPEPGTWLLTGAGLALGFVKSRNLRSH